MKFLSFSQGWRATLASTVGLATLLSAGSAAAALTSYTDVEANAWYEQSAAHLLANGALDSSQTKLRPNDLSTRAEVFKMLVDLNDERLIYPSTPSFSDVPRSAWYFPYVEAAAKAGWLRGDNNCYGQGLSTCTARPSGNVNRAEMSALMQRAFGLSYTAAAPRFPDVPTGQWYFNAVQSAADHCILQGDANTGLVRPAAFMNRAEMVVMFDRADQNLRYGEDCGIQPEPIGNISSISSVSDDTIRVTFNVDLDPNREDDMDRYTVERISNGDEIDISDLEVINARIIELTVDDPLSMNVQYRLRVDDMRTRGGSIFSDSDTFTAKEGTSVTIDSVTVRANNMLRVHFTEDVADSRADDISRYTIERTSNGADVDIDDITIVDDQTVDITLSSALASQTSYRLSVDDLTDEDGVAFSDDFTFNSAQSSSLTLQSVTALSNTRLRLQFSGAVDEDTAENESNYVVTDVSGLDNNVALATLTGDSTVELILDNALQTQQFYTVRFSDIENTGGTTFTGTGGTVFGTSNVLFDAMLRGSSEVPSNPSSATGTGTFILTSTGLQYDITVRGLSGSAITDAHFHRGEVGVAGPVVEPISFGSSNHVTGTWTNLTVQERDDILDGRIYVNVHSAAYPNGEIRGQVERQ